MNETRFSSPVSRWEQPRMAAALLVLGLAVGAAVAVDYRLPDDVIPDNYALKMVPYLELNNMRFDGSVDITVTAQRDTTGITLHAHADLKVTVVDVVDAATLESMSPGDQGTRTPENEFFVIGVQKKLEAGKQYIIKLTFSGPLQKDNRGFYLSSYKGPKGFE